MNNPTKTSNYTIGVFLGLIGIDHGFFDILQSKFITTGLFFLLIILSGFWLSRAGRPYSMLKITIHKLIGLAAGIYLALTVYRIYKVAPLSPVQIATVIVTVLFFAINVTTGSLLSTNKPMPKTVSIINRFFPYLTIVITGIMLYLFT